MIEFTCTCGKPLQADEQHAGRLTRCPACGLEQPIPARGGAIQEDAPADRGRARPTDFQEELGRRRDAAPREYDRPPPPATSGKAIAALVLGLLSFAFVCLTGLPALVLGMLALMDIAKSGGRLGGRGLAVAGMVLSALSLLCIGPALGLAGFFSYGLVRDEGNRRQSQNNLKQLGIGMHYYHESYGYFPPAQGFAPGMGIPGAPGTRPKVSWRVLILPFIDEGNLGNLYQMYNFDEPWDGPNNSRLLTMMPKVYELPGDTTAPPGHTYYQVFVSAPSAVPHALFSTDPTAHVRIMDITDGTANTLMIVEAATPVPWTKPDDIPFDPNGAPPRLGTHFNGGCNAVFADGTVRFLPGNLSPTTLKALITRDGGEIVSGSDF